MSFSTSLTGLKNAQTDLNVISHNIANAETGGFKKSNTAFADIVAATSSSDPSMVTGMGASVASIRQDFSLGPIEQTGNALDVAIDGEGFFTVVSPLSGKTQYTRNGSFSVDDQGYIKNDQHARLQAFPVDAGGAIGGGLQPLRIPATNAAGSDYTGVSVAADGKVVATYADGSNTTLGVVALATFTSPGGLKQMGNATWEPTGVSGAASYGRPGESSSGSLLAGSLERSNVDIAEELVSLITAQRNFQANAKAIDTATQITQSVMNLRTS